MIKDGKGGANTNANGLRFAKDISLEAALHDNGYEVVATDWTGTEKEQTKEVRDEEGIVGYLVPKRALARFLRKLYLRGAAGCARTVMQRLSDNGDGGIDCLVRCPRPHFCISSQVM